MKFRAICFPAAFLVAAISLIFSPRANAIIIEVETATSCPGSLGGGLCNGNNPFQLSALLPLLSAPNSIYLGTQKYIVTNDIADSFSFSLTGTGQNNTGVADNGVCQINGGATSFFNACSIIDSTGDTFTLLGNTHTGQINGVTFPITVTFSGDSFGDTFKLGFVSWQGTSQVSVPGPIVGAQRDPVLNAGAALLTILSAITGHLALNPRCT